MSDRIKVIYGASSLGDLLGFSDKKTKTILDVLERYGVKDIDTATLYV